MEEVVLPLSDQNSWYYPSHGYDADEERSSIYGGNWGKKDTKNARWVRKGKMTAWGPTMDDWEADERARRHVKLLLQRKRSPSPPTLPHLRSVSPPHVSPYPPPTNHLSYSSFVMDQAVTHSFRSDLLNELEQATNGLIEGEATLRKALGRLWEVISESPDGIPNAVSLIPKQEDEDGVDHEDERERRAPDLTPAAHRLFLISSPVPDSSHFASPELQMESLEKALATLRELQDDGREYVERLQEIREGLGDAEAQRNSIWDMVREKAIKELRGEAEGAFP